MFNVENFYYFFDKLLIPVIFFFFVIFLRFLLQDKIYRYPNKGWMSVKEYPIPEDIKYFLATDGEHVDCIYEPKWAPRGGVYFNSYRKTFVKYWQPLPEAPKESILLFKKGE